LDNLRLVSKSARDLDEMEEKKNEEVLMGFESAADLRFWRPGAGCVLELSMKDEYITEGKLCGKFISSGLAAAELNARPDWDARVKRDWSGAKALRLDVFYKGEPLNLSIAVCTQAGAGRSGSFQLKTEMQTLTLDLLKDGQALEGPIESLQIAVEGPPRALEFYLDNLRLSRK
jgi:hypothetical protein